MISVHCISLLNTTAENFSYLLGCPSVRKVERMFINNMYQEMNGEMNEPKTINQISKR